MIDLIKASQGDKEAFDKIILEYNEKVITIASIYMGNDYADVVQDIWVKIFRKKHLLVDVKNFDNWLFLVVRNSCFNQLKLERERRKEYELSLYDDFEYNENNIHYPDILDKIIRDEKTDEIRFIIHGLKEIYSLPIIMRYIKGMTLEEISKILDLSLSTVKWRLNAGKLNIKKEIIKLNGGKL